MHCSLFVLRVPSKGSEECTEAFSCRLQQLNVFGSLSIRSRQGLASLQYLGGGRRWTGRQTNLSCCTTSHSKLHISSFLSFLTITCVAQASMARRLSQNEFFSKFMARRLSQNEYLRERGEESFWRRRICFAATILFSWRRICSGSIHSGRRLFIKRRSIFKETNTTVINLGGGSTTAGKRSSGEFIGQFTRGVE